MMYEMATGKLPFVAADTSTVSKMHIENKPTRPGVFNQKLPQGLEQIILRAMEKPAFMRFQSAEEMLRDVLSLQNNMNMIFDYNRSEDERGELQPEGNGVKWWVYALLGVAAAFILSLIVTIVAVTIISSSKNTLKTAREYERGGAIWTETADE